MSFVSPCRRRIHRRPLLLQVGALLAVAASGPSLATELAIRVSFAASADVLSDSERDRVREHTYFAAQQWARQIELVGSPSLEVEIAISDIATASGASLSSAFLTRVGNRDIFEQGAASELRTGVDPNGASPDLRITLGLAYLRNELWFDPAPSQRQAMVPLDRTDAMSVFMHEFGHALAYNGFANGQGVLPIDFGSSFDRWIQSGAPPLFSGPTAVSRFGSSPELTLNNVFHWGNSVTQAAGAAPAMLDTYVQADFDWQISGPVPLEQQEDWHLQSAELSKAGNPLQNELMFGPFYMRGHRYHISNLDLGVLADVGLVTGRSALFGNSFEDPGR